jgi:ketosteroid isomerase-like protein
MSIDVEFFKQVYERFNARDIEAVLAVLHPDVTWANGMEGGHVHGREAVRSYWTRQWAAIDPRVEPTTFSTGADGEIVADVHQTLRDLQGAVLADRMVGHIFRIENGLSRASTSARRESPDSHFGAPASTRTV